jgi:tetratricopeptide (TPR) repeat protein
VLKALQPEPHERYPTVDALIDDLRRYLDARPVAARSQVATYVLARALRRHRWWVGAAAAIVLSLSVGLAGTGWHARQARIERDVARQEADRADAVRQYLIYMFRNTAEMEAPATLKAKAVLDDAAQRLHDHFSGDPARAATMMQALGELYFLISDYEGGIPLLQQLLTVAERGAGLPDDALARTRYTLGQMYERVGRNEDAAAMLAQAQAFWAIDARHHRRDLVRSRVLEAQLHRERGDLLAALAVLERAQEESVAVFDRDDRESGVLQDSLGRLYFSLGRPDDADAALTEAWRIWEARRSTLSADALSTLNGQAALAAQRGDYGAAEDLYRRALDQRRALFGPSRALSTLLGNYGRLRLLQHDAAAAKPLLQEALLLARRYTGERSPQVLVAMVGLADAHTQLGETAEAAALLEQARADSVVATGAAYPLALMVEMSWVRLHMAERRYPDARHLLDTAASRLEALGVSGVRYLPQVEQLRAELAAL